MAASDFRISPEQVKARIDAGEPVFFVDARNPTAWGEAMRKLPDALRIPASEIEQHLGELPGERMIVAYCT